jgi:hypothetical protein
MGFNLGFKGLRVFKNRVLRKISVRGRKLQKTGEREREREREREGGGGGNEGGRGQREREREREKEELRDVQCSPNTVRFIRSGG